ncbi:tRNA-guanine transglycosylase DpdA [Leptolyngbya sp. GGD]|uniref:tRNA-guanine transglycosylase DpdA n=1 Tax=Leptolyngbya sp. GGD TaxID=2997907 RepID=UPI00227CE266|nr:tRNA-guanine transglycosylase DpdA [Leptolyngbya sp. GGD]MCY6493399.1 tRNA-guanine transglycosylase DpdA [Leptolyngbya sp. GGD]
MRHPRVLIITSCTGEKRFKPESQLAQGDFVQVARLRKREKQLSEFMSPAGEMYTGMQHIQLMEGVRTLRKASEKPAIDVVIISAGYGLIAEDRAIVPYEVTFNTMKGHEIDAWAKQLKIHQSIEKIIPDYDLIFVLLGEKYLRAISLPLTLHENQTWIFLAPGSCSNLIQASNSQAFVLSLSNAEAKKYGFGSVGLKGFLFKQFSLVAAEQPELFEQIHQNPRRFLEIIDTNTQLELNLGLPKLATKSKPKQVTPKKSRDEFVPIPDLPPAPNTHLGMQYFIPEWDDRVDPQYNFLTDSFSPDRHDSYADDVYAHEIFSPTPNYDGVLVSKAVIDESQTKRNRVEELGIHKFVRFAGKIMGDCGAFSYIKEDVPPYNTDEILDYYERLNFDFGVSIDHLIVGPFATVGVRDWRYELTLKNAAEFLTKHRERGYQFTPIGVAQGWSPESYASAVQELIKMGYDYIALGGLARAQNHEILPILKAIHPHLIPTVRMHLFGVARVNAVSAFRHLGVTSCDSASPLRQAWLGATANYYTASDKRYAAIRVPPVDNKGGLRVKRLLEAEVANEKTLKRLEKDALRSLREFDSGKLDLESTLQAVLAYDELLELPKDGKADLEAQAKRRKKHEVLYREVLETQPWKACNCPICQEIGIEVIIFRNNNRNRRRGFHNTYVFYKRFKELLGESKELSV